MVRGALLFYYLVSFSGSQHASSVARSLWKGATIINCKSTRSSKGNLRNATSANTFPKDGFSFNKVGDIVANLNAVSFSCLVYFLTSMPISSLFDTFMLPIWSITIVRDSLLVVELEEFGILVIAVILIVPVMPVRPVIQVRRFSASDCCNSEKIPLQL